MIIFNIIKMQLLKLMVMDYGIVLNQNKYCLKVGNIHFKLKD